MHNISLKNDFAIKKKIFSIDFILGMFGIFSYLKKFVWFLILIGCKNFYIFTGCKKFKRLKFAVNYCTIKLSNAQSKSVR